MEKQSLTKQLEAWIQYGDSSSFIVLKIVSIIATELRKQGQQANTYDKQDQWEAAAKLVEDME